MIVKFRKYSCELKNSAHKLRPARRGVRGEHFIRFGYPLTWKEFHFPKVAISSSHSSKTELFNRIGQERTVNQIKKRTVKIEGYLP